VANVRHIEHSSETESESESVAESESESESKSLVPLCQDGWMDGWMGGEKQKPKTQGEEGTFSGLRNRRNSGRLTARFLPFNLIKAWRTKFSHEANKKYDVQESTEG